MQNANEKVFQQDIIDHLVSTGWKLGESAKYDRKHALYTEDLVGYLSETQPEQWDKFSKMHPEECRTAEQGTAEFRRYYPSIRHFLFDILRFKRMKRVLCFGGVLEGCLQ